jgi:hypothetical protein
MKLQGLFFGFTWYKHKHSYIHLYECVLVHPTSMIISKKNVLVDFEIDKVAHLVIDCRQAHHLVLLNPKRNSEKNKSIYIKPKT